MPPPPGPLPRRHNFFLFSSLTYAVYLCMCFGRFYFPLTLAQGMHYTVDDDDEDWSSSGDVKYHLGTSMDRTYPDGRR